MLTLSILKTSIGKKILMAGTGFVMFGFVFVHMFGNLQIYLGSDILNSYAEFLKDLGALLWVFRIVLLLCVVVHVTLAIILSLENRKARPIKYVYEKNVQVTLAARTMTYTGLVIFAFIIYHLMHFTFGFTNPEHILEDTKGRHDVYKMVILGFQNPFISSAYLIAMVFLFLHVRHGVASIFQTLGLSRIERRDKFQLFADIFATIIFLGNVSIPITILMGIIK